VVEETRSWNGKPGTYKNRLVSNTRAESNSGRPAEKAGGKKGRSSNVRPPLTNRSVCRRVAADPTGLIIYPGTRTSRGLGQVKKKNTIRRGILRFIAEQELRAHRQRLKRGMGGMQKRGGGLGFGSGDQAFNKRVFRKLVSEGVSARSVLWVSEFLPIIAKGA